MDQIPPSYLASNFADLFPGLSYIQDPSVPLKVQPRLIVAQRRENEKKEFIIDGVAVPKLNLGESGRAELKSLISRKQKERPDLKQTCDKIAKVKSASIVELLTIARICGLWEEAERIASRQSFPHQQMQLQRLEGLGLENQQILGGFSYRDA
jgi:hypothetical protein